MSEDQPAPAAVRLDKWLWAARCFKTRGLASEACSAGHVKINGESVKPAKMVRAGDEIVIKIAGGHTRIWIVLALAERRGPAAAARALYEDRSPPPPPREEAGPVLPVRERGAGRPSKRERRKLGDLRGY